MELQSALAITDLVITETLYRMRLPANLTLL